MCAGCLDLLFIDQSMKGNIVAITRFFDQTLGAKLKNSRWSWGASDEYGRVFLRVWVDQIQHIDSHDEIQIGRKSARLEAQAGHGYDERITHIRAIMKGAEAYGVLCVAIDPDTNGPRRIKYYDEHNLLLLGKITEDNELYYAQIDAHIPVLEIVRTRSTNNPTVNDLKSILSNERTVPTVAEMLVQARIGQGAFRRNVLRIWNSRCAVSSSSTLDVIRASHIKPWRDSTDHERLDPANGLPLLANYDALFDAGLISFDDNGCMIVSSSLNVTERVQLDIIGKRLTTPVSEKTMHYLEFHRTHIFRKDLCRE